LIADQTETKRVVLVHSDEYANWVFEENHPTQGRRFISAKRDFTTLMAESGLSFLQVAPRTATATELRRVHSSRYIEEVLTKHESGEWSGSRPDLAALSQLFAGGTLVALEELLSSSSEIAIHFPGAKHHAQHEYSSGFCVFADFSLAATVASEDYGLKVAVLDIDAHHGDGTENLTRDNDNVLTFSVHEWGLFPGTGFTSDIERNCWNFPLGRETENSHLGLGDEALYAAIETFIRVAAEFNPELVLIACGADGHRDDPLSNLGYSIEAFETSAKLLMQSLRGIPVLMGGAGGYLPDTRTPEVWSKFAFTMAAA
jgi:acetoin utilization protein AcuC